MTRRAKTTKKAAAFPSPAQVRQATFDLIAEKGYGKTRLSDLADRFKVKLTDFHATYPSVDAIIHDFLNDVDNTMLSTVNPKSASNKREIYFDMMMARMDALQEHRDGVVRWLKEIAKQPQLWVGILKRWQSSLTLMLDIAKDSPVYPVKKIGLAGVYAVTLKTWVEDDTADMAKTMATLDKALGKAENIAEKFLKRPKRS